MYIRLTERRSGESHSLLHDVSATLIELEFEVLLLRLRTSWVVGVNLLVLEMRVELMNPLLEDPQEHN